MHQCLKIRQTNRSVLISNTAVCLYNEKGIKKIYDCFIQITRIISNRNENLLFITLHKHANKVNVKN